MTIHVYSAPFQPFTHYKDDLGESAFTVTHNPRELHRCHNCGRGRWAKNLRVQVYYDKILVTCVEGCTPRRLK
jgi:hypothetical protein